LCKKLVVTKLVSRITKVDLIFALQSWSLFVFTSIKERPILSGIAYNLNTSTMQQSVCVGEQEQFSDPSLAEASQEAKLLKIAIT
jgi:hypothetical protein